MTTALTELLAFYKKRGKMSFACFLALRVLGELGPMTAGSLARKLGCRPAQVTRIGECLAVSGLIVREVNPKDRRSVFFRKV